MIEQAPKSKQPSTPRTQGERARNSESLRSVREASTKPGLSDKTVRAQSGIIYSLTDPLPTFPQSAKEATDRTLGRSAVTGQSQTRSTGRNAMTSSTSGNSCSVKSTYTYQSNVGCMGSTRSEHWKPCDAKCRCSATKRSNASWNASWPKQSTGYEILTANM